MFWYFSFLSFFLLFLLLILKQTIYLQWIVTFSHRTDSHFSFLSCIQQVPFRGAHLPFCFLSFSLFSLSFFSRSLYRTCLEQYLCGAAWHKLCMSFRRNWRTFVDYTTQSGSGVGGGSLSIWMCICLSECLLTVFLSLSPWLPQLQSHVLSLLSFSLTVKFVNCGQGGLVQFECSNPSDFHIEADGVVYALRPLTVSTLRAVPLVIVARDETNQQQWQTQVRLTPPIGQSQQVRPTPPHTSSLFHPLLSLSNVSWLFVTSGSILECGMF